MMYHNVTLSEINKTKCVFEDKNFIDFFSRNLCFERGFQTQISTKKKKILSQNSISLSFGI